MACEACEHCHVPLHEYESVTREGFSYHRECLKCYVCDETNLKDCEVFKGVIFCSSCSKRIFQGCSTARHNKHARRKRRSRSRSCRRRRRASSRPRSRKGVQRGSGVIRLARMASSTESVSYRYGKRQLEILSSIQKDTSEIMSYNQNANYANDSADYMKQISKEMGITTEFTQQLLKEMHCPVIEMNTILPCSVSKCATKDAMPSRPRKISPQKHEERAKNPIWSDMRVAELGASTEIANMALRKQSKDTELQFTNSKIIKQTDSLNRSNVTDISDDGLEEWLDSTNKPKSPRLLHFLDRPLRSIMRLPYKYFKTHILNRSSLVNMLLSGDDDDDFNFWRKLKMMYNDEVTDHHRRGIKRLYSTINRRTHPYQLGWLHLDIDLPRKNRSSEDRQVTYKCKHFRHSHSYRCLRAHVMKLAGPTKSELAIIRKKIKTVLEFPVVLKNFLMVTTIATQLICQTCSCHEGIIDCKGKDIRSPFTLADWEGLKPSNPITVDLSGNPLTTLTRISQLPIQTLNLSSCELESIENSCLHDLSELVTLDLSRNKLATSAISRRIFEPKPRTPFTGGGPMDPPQQLTSKLRALNLSHNDIHSLPQDLFFFVQDITHLDLSGNPLAYIDQVTMAAITELTKLKELRLSGCELESLPEGLLRRQRRIERLDISDNRFTTVPGVLAESANLLYLNLDRNPIENITRNSSISSLTKLQDLHLCRLSKLQSIGPSALGGLENLVSLRVSYNPRLTNLDPTFLMWEDDHEVERYPLLKQLYLNNNNLSSINGHLLSRWDTLSDVDFSGNPYQCDCSIQWMVQVLVPLIISGTSNETTKHMFCKKPLELRGLSFAQLREQGKTLTCSEAENIADAPGPDMAILLGIMIGIFVTFPIVLIIILLWRRGYFARACTTSRKSTSDDEETDAF